MTAPLVILLVILHVAVAVLVGWYNSDMRKMSDTAEGRRWHARLVLLAPLWPLVIIGLIVYGLVRHLGRWIKEVWNDAR